MSSGNKVTKFRKHKDIKIGVIVFLIIFVYVLINVSMYFTKEHLSIYEVKEGSTSDDNVFTGLIIRDEEVISTDTAGYINYYHRDGDRISKKATIFSVDENKNLHDLIGNSDSAPSLSSDDITTIKKEIFTFQKKYNNSDYSTVYDFKYDIENTALELVNNKMFSNLQDVLDDNAENNTFQVKKSDSSGIITYSVDNLESLTADSVNADHFKLDNYNKTQLRTMDIIEANSPVYKIVKSDKWNIILLLDESQYEKLLEKETISITFSDDGLTTTVPISIYKKDGYNFAKLTLNKYLVRYLSQRYVTVELAINSAKGLKIPVSSIIQKDFYKIPLEYFTIGGDSGSTGLSREFYNTNGDVEILFIPAEIYFSDDTHGYVDARLFEDGNSILSIESDKRFEVREKATLDGVFNVNKGYATFRRIEKLYENEEYCIIDNNTKYGLSVYDHIALNGKTAVEQAIIY